MKTDFRSWPQPTLADFAEASRTRMAEQDARMLEQDARINVLEDDLRVAIDSYRLLMTRTAPSQLSLQ